MIRKIVSLHLFAALLALAATNFAEADCASCGGGCEPGGCKLATGSLLGKLRCAKGCASAGCDIGCQSGGCATGCVDGGCHTGCAGNGLCGGNCGGRCGGKLLGGCLGGGCNSEGPCRTCDNIWDDYCASKSQCLPAVRYPLQKFHRGGRCGGCGLGAGSCGCGAGGVGIYGQQDCGCGPKLHHGLLKKLFTHKKRVTACAAPAPCADVPAPCAAAPAPCAAAPAACDDGCCDGGGCAAVVAAPAVQHSQPYVQVRPLYRTAPPVAESQPVPTTTPVVSPPEPAATAPVSTRAISDPVPPVPPAPSVSDQTSSSGAFNWLQRALKLN